MIVSKDNYDGMGVKKISVIASFDNKGNVSPLYVRIGEDSWKVKSFSLKTENKNILIFGCNVFFDNEVRPVTLSFHRNDNVWTIPENIVDFD